MPAPIGLGLVSRKPTKRRRSGSSLKGDGQRIQWRVESEVSQHTECHCIVRNLT